MAVKHKSGNVFSNEYTIYCELYICLELCRTGEAVNNRTYASPSFEVDTPRKITAISAIIIIIIIIIITPTKIMITTNN